MIWEDLDKKLIHLQAEAEHANDIFEQLGGCFVNENKIIFYEKSFVSQM